jgi:hypothetical protein
MLPGVKLRVRGVLTTKSQNNNKSNNQEQTLLIQNASVLGWPRNPQHVRILLDVMSQGRLSMEDLPLPRRYENSSLLISIMNRDSQYAVAKEIVQESSRNSEEEDDDDDYPRELFANFNAGDYRLPPAPDHLRQAHPRPLLLASEDSISSGLVTLQATVSSRRRYRDNITVLELIPDDDDMVEASIKGSRQPHRRQRWLALLHPAHLLDAPASAGVLGNVVAATSRVRVSGWIPVADPAPRGNISSQGRSPEVKDDDDRDESSSSSSVARESMLYVTAFELVQAPWQPKTLEYLVDMASLGKFDNQQAASALGITLHRMTTIVSMQSTTERQWAAAELSQQIQQTPRRSEHTGSSGSIVQDSKIILAPFRSVTELYPVEYIGPPGIDSNPNRTNDNFSSDGSRWRRKKEPQMNWMLQQVEHLIHRHPNFKQRPIRILDIGGGKGLLANHLATHLNRTIEIQVIDIAPRAIQNGAMRSKRLQLPVQYMVADASQVRLSPQSIDMVVALHACGGLTDVALGHAVIHKAAFVICPCCFRSHPNLNVPTLLLNENDMQAQRLVAHEWLGVDRKEYSDLQRLAEVQGDLAVASRAIHSICAIRSLAVERACPELNVSVKTFPIAYSTRNFCLVGSRRS